MQNVSSRLTLWRGDGSASPDAALTWVCGLAKGGGIATGDDLVAHLRSLRDGATRLL